MQTRSLGNTGIEVSVIGLGTVKFGRNQGVKYPTPFELPTDKQIDHLLSCANELGINLLDTAPAYGSSEERIGKLLTNRHAWVIATKVGENFNAGISSFNFSADAIQKSVERSLCQLKTDYLDIVLVHSNGDDVALIQEQNVFETLSQLKQNGKLRAFGMSTKTIAGGLLALAQSDVAMVTYHPGYIVEKEIIQYAHANKKGILIKKALASGHLQNSAADNMQFILNEPGVNSIVVGTLNTQHLRENVQGALKHNV